jgi:hypothetical protein
MNSDFDYLVRGFQSSGGKNDSGENNRFQEVESASLLIRQKMFDRLVEIKEEKDVLTVYLKYDLAEKASNCLGGKNEHILKNFDRKNVLKKSFAAVKSVRSEMYAYNLVNCVANNSNKYVTQFWRFYRGEGLQKKKFGISRNDSRSKIYSGLL